jgi:hypothetical protein
MPDMKEFTMSAMADNLEGYLQQKLLEKNSTSRETNKKIRQKGK